jgi:PBSX family phage terminase large subunit
MAVRLEDELARRVAAKLMQPAAMLVRGDYKPFGTAVEAFLAREGEVLISGPAGTGKSRGILEKLHRRALQFKGARCLIVRKTRESLTETTLVTYEEEVLGEDNPILRGRGGGRINRRNRAGYEYPNGSVVALGGMDKPTKILSSQWDLIYVPEAIELHVEDWEALITRLRNGATDYHQLIADTNPASPMHWLKRRCDEGKTRIIYSTHEDNPRYFNHQSKDWTAQGREYLARLESLSGVRRERFRYGRWVKAEGAVYEFDPAVHVADKFTIPPEWRRIRAIDFGYQNPFVCQWWAVDHDGCMWLYREIYMSRGLVEDHAKLINQLSEGEHIEATVADHDAEDRATLERYGIFSQPALKSIRAGVDAVSGRLRVDERGRPGLQIMRGALVGRDEVLYESKKPICTEDEFAGYVWAKGRDGAAMKESPVDLDNHGMDAMRYAAMYFAGAGAGVHFGQVKAVFSGRRHR